MKFKILPHLFLATIGCAFLTVNGCSHNPAWYDSTHHYAAVSGREAGITGWLLVLNKNEINAAKMARRKAVTSTVRNYAEMMLIQHTQNYNLTLNVANKLHIKPVYTPCSAALEKSGIKEMRRLSVKSGTDFDRAYMTAMVNGHAMALRKLDYKIMKVKNVILKNHLEQTRNAVRLHLQEAEQIQRNL